MDQNHRVQNFILNNFPFDHFFCRPIFSCVFERGGRVAVTFQGSFKPGVGYVLNGTRVLMDSNFAHVG